MTSVARRYDHLTNWAPASAGVVSQTCPTPVEAQSRKAALILPRKGEVAPEATEGEAA